MKASPPPSAPPAATFSQNAPTDSINAWKISHMNGSKSGAHNYLRPYWPWISTLVSKKMASQAPSTTSGSQSEAFHLWQSARTHTVDHGGDDDMTHDQSYDYIEHSIREEMPVASLERVSAMFYRALGRPKPPKGWFYEN